MNQTTKLFFHLAIALVLMPLQTNFGEGIKILLAPYIFYLVWSRNPNYLPALFVHFTPGTTISFVILITTFGLTLTNFYRFWRSELKWILLLILLPFPFLLYQTFNRVFFMGLGIVETLKPLAFYLGGFPFYYGILVANKIDSRVLKSLLLTLFILPFLRIFPFITYTIRPYWLSFPLFSSIVGAKLFIHRKFNFPMIWTLLGILFLIFSVFGFFELKFTLIFSSLISIMALISSQSDKKRILKIIGKPKTILIVILLTASVIIGYERYGRVDLGNQIDVQNVNYLDWDEFSLYLRYKIFDDRSVIWAGGWDFLMQERLFWPPYEVPTYSYESSRGSIIEEVEFGIHNIGLELMRNYGILLGSVLTITFLSLLILGPGKYLRGSKNDPYLLILAAACLGTGLVGGMVGQFVLMSSFSFLLLSLCGILNWFSNVDL